MGWRARPLGREHWSIRPPVTFPQAGAGRPSETGGRGCCSWGTTGRKTITTSSCKIRPAGGWLGGGRRAVGGGGRGGGGGGRQRGRPGAVGPGAARGGLPGVPGQPSAGGA